MITEICNNNQEHHIDVFYKIAILEKSHLPVFNHLVSDADVISYITNLPGTAQALITGLLPKNLKVDSNQKITKSGVLHSFNISFLITPQDKNLQQLLETFNNKEVVVLISKHNFDHLYGTEEQPLLFSYKPINSNDPKALKGYQINIKGVGYGPEIIFENITFNIYNRGLAFQLAQSL